MPQISLSKVAISSWGTGLTSEVSCNSRTPGLTWRLAILGSGAELGSEDMGTNTHHAMNLPGMEPERNDHEPVTLSASSTSQTYGEGQMKKGELFIQF